MSFNIQVSIHAMYCMGCPFVRIWSCARLVAIVQCTSYYQRVFLYLDVIQTLASVYLSIMQNMCNMEFFLAVIENKPNAVKVCSGRA